LSDNQEPSKNKEKSPALRVIQRHIKQFGKIKTPTIRLQEQIDRISFPHNQISKIIEAQDRFRNWAILPDQLEQFRNRSLFSTELTDRIELFRSTQQFQDTLRISQQIQDSLKGFQIDIPLFESIVQFDDISSRFSEIQESLAADSIFLGEYDLPIYDSYDEKLEESEEGSELILPESIKESLEKVNFLPVRVIQKIYDNPNLLKKMGSRDFEHFIAELLERLGFKGVEVTPRSGDGGRDILATQFVNDIPILIALECKRYGVGKKIKPEIMRALFGTVSASKTKVNKGVLVTTSTFSKGAKEFIMSEPLVGGKDFYDLVKWIEQTKNKK